MGHGTHQLTQTSWASRPLGTMSRGPFWLDGGNSIGVQPVMVLGLGYSV